MADLQEYVGKTVDVVPLWADTFFEFTGTVIGVRNGLLQVRGQDDAVHEVEVGQVTVVEAPSAGQAMEPVCPRCGAVNSLSEIDRVAVLQKVQSVTAEGNIELVTEAGDVDWECQYSRDNPPEFQCGECGEECSEDELIEAARKAQS